MEQIGKYKILGHIGHGAMGSVEKAEAPDGTIVAIKTLYPQFVYEDEYVRRFKREAELAKKLSHPNVVKIIDVGEDNEGRRQYIVMEYIYGKTLAECMYDKGMEFVAIKRSSRLNEKDEVGSEEIKTQKVTPSITTFTSEETIKIIRQLAGVLQAAADIGLMHRDVKPQNILLDKKGNAKLLDFGLAKDTEALVSMLSMTGQSIGTPPYMSPEQHEGHKEIDLRSDLYSLGCTVYHMLTGKPPFDGPTNSAYALQHQEEIPVSVRKLNPDCPLNLSQVIDRLLAKNPDLRYQDAAELIEDLNRVERGETPVSIYKPKKKKKHNPLITWTYVAVSVLIMAGAFVGYNLYRSSNAQAIIKTAMTDARQMAFKREFEEAKDKLDVVIAEYALDNPELIKDMVKLRDKIIEQHSKWVTGEVSRAELERKRQEKKAETERARKLHGHIRDAARLCQNENTCKQATTLIDQAYRLCYNDAERAKVAAAETKVKEALNKVRPWAAVADFSMDKSVEVKLSGSAIATKMLQALGGKYRLVTRSQVNKALKELRFQAGDLMDKTNAKNFGKMIGAEFLITGRVVQIGKEVSIGCEIIDIETCAIKQTAEVSAFSVDEFNHMIRDAAEILCMSNVEKKVYIDEKYNYPKHLEQGKKNFAASDYEEAVRVFKRAKRAKRTNEIDVLLKSAEAKVEEQRILNERKAKYEMAMSQGNKLLREQRWLEAEKLFQEALKVIGYEFDRKANEGIKTAQGGADAFRIKEFKKQFDDLIKSAKVSLAKQDWKGAEKIFNQALAVKGYEFAEEALRGICNAKGGAEQMCLRNAATAEYRAVMAYAQEALKKATLFGYKDDGFKWQCSAGVNKLVKLEGSIHYSYLSKANQRKIGSLKNHLNNLYKDYQIKFTTYRATQEGEKVYSEASKLYRDGRLLDKKKPEAYSKCSKAVKLVVSLIKSSHYRYITRSAKSRLMALKKQTEKYLKTLEPPRGSKWTMLSLGMKFVYVAPGSFQMGSNNGNSSKKAVHKVTISNGYWIGKYEVTQDEYKKINGKSLSRFSGSRNPVERVSWNDAVAFCKKLTEHEHKAGRLPAGYEYRLPTEAEWEYAARGGNKSRGYKYSGSNNLAEVGWYTGNSGSKIHEVGTKKGNELGIYDMSGNVWEWCLDNWHGSYKGVAGDGSRRGDGTGLRCMPRGGSWSNSARNCRSANRYFSPGYAGSSLGFRVAIAPVQR